MAEKYLGYVIDRIRSSDSSKGDNALLKVIAKKEKGVYKKISHMEARECCPPLGQVFAPGFFNANNVDFYDGSFVEFEIKENQKKDKKVVNQTEYIINFNSRPKAINLPRLVAYNGKLDKILSRGYLSPKELNATLDKENIFSGEDAKFFLFDSVKQKGIGVFKYKKATDSVESSYGKDVQEFTIDKDFVLERKGVQYLLFNEKQNVLGRGRIIDFMTDQQLADWLKIKMKGIASLDAKTLSLICEFPEAQSLEDDMDVSRFQRLKEKAEAFEIDIQTLAELICKHSGYFRQYMSKIDLIAREVEEYLNEKYLSEASETIKANQKEIESQKAEIIELGKTLASEKDRVSSEIAKERERLEKENENLSKQVEEKNARLRTLNENYDAVIATISAIAPVLNVPVKTSAEECVYKLNRIDFPKGENARSYSQMKAADGESFISFIKRHVCCDDEKIITYLKQIKNVFTHKACFIPNTAIAYLYAKALRNTEVVMLHVEHDWLHYSDFVKHGLLEAFTNAHENSEKNYILVFDGINVTQPECGLRPLLNLISGAVPVLEGCEFAFPNNMTIMATVLPSKEPYSVGLKLNPAYFSGWFAIGDPSDENGKVSLPENFLDMEVKDNCGYMEPSDLKIGNKEDEKAGEFDKYLEF